MQVIRERIHETLTELLEPWLDADDPDVSEQTNLISDIGLDSVAVLQFILSIESTFAIKINEHEMDANMFSKFANLIDIVQRKTNETN